jgi:hypothetical protein
MNAWEASLAGGVGGRWELNRGVSFSRSRGYRKRYSGSMKVQDQSGESLSSLLGSSSKSSLLVQVFHGGGTENNEESHPQSGSLERDGFIGLFLMLFLRIGFEDDCIEKERQ